MRPKLTGGADHAQLCSIGALLAGALERLAGCALRDGELGEYVRQVLALTPVETALVAMHPRWKGAALTPGVDGFLTADRPDFVEFNPDSPMGPLTQEALAEIFAETSAMRASTEGADRG